jgi:hypothetical protein
MAATIVKVPIDWADAFGWQCPFCCADVDHLHDEDNGDGTINASYTCQAPRHEQGELCGRSYFVVRFDTNRSSSNGDALTLERFIEIEIGEQYVNKETA